MTGGIPLGIPAGGDEVEPSEMDDPVLPVDFHRLIRTIAHKRSELRRHGFTNLEVILPDWWGTRPYDRAESICGMSARYGTVETPMIAVRVPGLDAHEAAAGAATHHLRQAVSLISDIDLDAVSARYGGLDSEEHDEVQTLVAFAREVRQIARDLR